VPRNEAVAGGRRTERGEDVGYALGVDLGTTYTAAATWRDGRTEVATLGSRSASVPSIVLVRDADTVLTGEAAERRAATEPDRVAREFKRRVGDTTPIFLAGSPYSAELLMSELLQWVVGEVAEREGGAPDRVAVSHPANWGAYKRELLDNAIRQADLGDAITLSEPEAAAIHYASTERVEVADTIAVYDLGGGTFDAAVLRKTDTGWETLGNPEGIERLGGIDFDAAVFAHVQRSLGGSLEELDEDDPTAMAAVGRLRQECTAAKEALSSDTDASIPVLLPNLQTQVRLTRGEFEDMIRPQISMTLDAMRRALTSARVTPEDVKVVLLVGGSSRIPLVAQMITADFGRPVNVDVHPKHAIALGAALAAAGEEDRRAGAAGAGAGAAGAAAAGVAGAGAAAAAAGADETGELAGVGAEAAGGGGAPTEPVVVGPPPGGGGEGTPPPRGRGGGPDDESPQRKGLIIAAAALVALLLIGGGVVLAAGGGGDGDGTTTTTTSSTSTSSTTTTTQPEVTTTRPRVTTTQPTTTTTAATTTTTAPVTTTTAAAP
jgi:actin-like ATPase involved in cell morphogenesis